jgi:hypothetical protein
MKITPLCLTVPLLLLLATAESGATDQATYRHPKLPFQFEASKGWTQIPHPEDRLIYHMVAPGGGLNVMLWYTETEQKAPGYLGKMANMKGYQTLTEARQEDLHRGAAWVLQAVGISKEHEDRVILAAIASGKGLYIVQIWCPLERYEEEKDTMEAILASVRLDS